ncbi:MAG TPA: hypothetical protein VIV12_25500 [Streptosporangiaceae bacterium]
MRSDSGSARRTLCVPETQPHVLSWEFAPPACRMDEGVLTSYPMRTGSPPPRLRRVALNYEVAAAEPTNRRLAVTFDELAVAI